MKDFKSYSESDRNGGANGAQFSGAENAKYSYKESANYSDAERTTSAGAGGYKGGAGANSGFKGGASANSGGFKGGTGANSGGQNADKASYDNTINLAATLAKAFNGKSEGQILQTIIAQAEQGKRNGTLTNADLDNFYATVSPMLDGIKRKKLQQIISKLKNI